MKPMWIFLILLFSKVCIFCQTSESASPIIFIYDASGSMWGQIDGTTKIEIASSVLDENVGKLSNDQRIGLVIYGHRREKDCEDVEFVVDYENLDKSIITKALQSIKPLGRTPLAHSATKVIDQLRSSGDRATIILITDGVESCGGDLCEVVKAARASGVDFRLHIVGFELEESDVDNLKCAADAAGGKYFDAKGAGELSNRLQEATAIRIDDPTPNFSLMALKDGTAIDAFVKAISRESKEITFRTYSDTGSVYLPKGQYDIVVQPLGGSDMGVLTLTDVEIQSAEERIYREVSFDGGVLKVTATNNSQGWDAVINITEVESGKSVARGRTYGRNEDFELNPGMYNVEMKALNIDGSANSHIIENVRVGGSQMQEVLHNFHSGRAMIGAVSGNDLVDAVITIVDPVTRKTVANGRTYTRPGTNPKEFVVTPGIYDVIVKALGKYKGKEERFSITIEADGDIEQIIIF